MFTLKLYQNGPLPPDGRTVIMEVVGVWADECERGVKHIHAFKSKVGVQDENGTDDFYVGGTPLVPQPENGDITIGRGGNYFSWGVLENAQGKTTEMFH